MTPPTPNAHHVQVKPLSSSLLLNEQPLYVIPELALTVNSPNGAMLLTQLKFLQKDHQTRKDAVIEDGRPWVPLSYPDWVKNVRGALSQSSIRRTLAQLEQNNFILTRTFRRGSKNRTKHYAVNARLLTQIYKERFLPAGLDIEENSDPFNPSESARLVFPTLAKALGTISRCIILQQLHFKLHLISSTPNPETRANNYRDGRYWYWHSIPQWHTNEFPFLTEDVVKESFLYLRQIGVVLVEKFNASDGDTTNWYSIDEGKLEEVLEEHAEGVPLQQPMPKQPIAIGSVQNPPTGSAQFPPTGSAQFPLTGSVQNPPTHEHSVSRPPSNAGSVQNPPPCSAQNPPPYIRDFKETNKESSSSNPTATNPETHPTSNTTTLDLKNLHPIITDTLHPGLLKELFRENPTRQQHWAALTNNDIDQVTRLIRTDTSQVKAGTKLIRALDTVATKNATNQNTASAERRTRALKQKLKAADAAEMDAFDQYFHLGHEERTNRASAARQAILALPLENFMEDTPDTP